MREICLFADATRVMLRLHVDAWKSDVAGCDRRGANIKSATVFFFFFRFE